MGLSIANRMSYQMNVLGRTTGHNNPMFIFKLVVALFGAVDHFAHHWEIFGMNAAGDQFESHGQIWGKVEDAVQFRRPSDLARLQSPGEGARAAAALALNHERFAAPLMF